MKILTAICIVLVLLGVFSVIFIVHTNLKWRKANQDSITLYKKMHGDEYTLNFEGYSTILLVCNSFVYIPIIVLICSWFVYFLVKIF